MTTEYEILTAEHGPLSPEDYREFRNWNRGNFGDSLVAFRYWLFGQHPTLGLAKSWRGMYHTEITLYPHSV